MIHQNATVSFKAPGRSSNSVDGGMFMDIPVYDAVENVRATVNYYGGA